MDDGFTYLVGGTTGIGVGSRVRVRVSNRRTKGFVTAVFEAEGSRRLLPLDGLSGSIPSFDAAMLETLRWAATHYVAPLSVLLKRTIPPNIPKIIRGNVVTAPGVDHTSPLEKSMQYRIGAAPYGALVGETISESVAADKSVVVIAPSALEVADIVSHLATRYPGRVVAATSSLPARETTESWSRIATEAGTILVGTREVMFWPFGNTAIVVVVEDGRRVMRSPRTPTLSVREVLLHRSSAEGFSLVFYGPVPTLEAIARGADVRVLPGREWPMVEVVDRTEDPPGGGVLTARATEAIQRSTVRGESTFLLVGSRGYAPASSCVSCGEVRRCVACGSAASRDEACRRCAQAFGRCAECNGARFQALGAGIGSVIEDVRRLVGAQVGRAEEEKLVTVGTERDLIGVSGVGLAVAIDVDGLSMAPHYRASEDALRLLVRLANTVRRGGGHRCLVQTALPNQDVIKALILGSSGTFLVEEMHARGRFGFPPVGELLAIEVEGVAGDRDFTKELIRERLGSLSTLLGPVQVGERTRWLVQGHDLERARVALRQVVSTLRSRGGRVRVDVDPIDL